MKTIASISRILLLLALSMLSASLFFGWEINSDLSAFLLHFLADKSLAVIIALCTVILYLRWSKRDRWIHAFHRWNTRDTEDYFE